MSTSPFKMDEQEKDLHKIHNCTLCGGLYELCDCDTSKFLPEKMIYYYKIALCDLYELYRIHDIYLSHEQHQHVFLAEFLSQNQHHILYKKILAFVSRSKMFFKVTFLCLFHKCHNEYISYFY